MAAASTLLRDENHRPTTDNPVDVHDFRSATPQAARVVLGGAYHRPYRSMVISVPGLVRAAEPGVLSDWPAEQDATASSFGGEVHRVAEVPQSASTPPSETHS